MTVMQEIDQALFEAIRAAETAPRDLQFLIVLSTDARNEFMREHTERKTVYQVQRGIMGTTYRGAVLAVTADPDMPRVSVFNRTQQK